jgi:hypothetical protein
MAKQNMIVRQEGDRVLLIMGGRLQADLHWKDALRIAKAITNRARVAENYDNLPQLIQDQAILIRAGVPMGLTSHPAALKEAVKSAEGDRNLRRFMRNNIRSKEIFGKPTLTQTSPKGDLR